MTKGPTVKALLRDCAEPQITVVERDHTTSRMTQTLENHGRLEIGYWLKVLPPPPPQRLQYSHSLIRLMFFQANKDQHLVSSAVNLFHHCYLLGAFYDTRLIDGQSIYPESPSQRKREAWVGCFSLPWAIHISKASERILKF